MASKDKINLSALLDVQLEQARLKKSVAQIRKDIQKAAGEGAQAGLDKLSLDIFGKKLTAVTRQAITKAQSGVLNKLASGTQFKDLSKRDQGTALRGRTALLAQSQSQREAAGLFRQQGFKQQSRELLEAYVRTTTQLKEINKQLDPVRAAAEEQKRASRLAAAIQKKNAKALQQATAANKARVSETLKAASQEAQARKQRDSHRAQISRLEAADRKALRDMTLERLKARDSLRQLGKGGSTTIGLNASSIQTAAQGKAILPLAKKELALLNAQLKRVEANFKSSHAATVKAQRAYNSQAKVVRDLTTRTRKLTEAEKGLSTAQKGLNKHLGQGTLLLRQFFRFAIGYSALFQALGAIKALVSGVVELDQELFSLQAITQATASEMEVLETAIKTTATTTKFGTGEIVKAARTLGQAGVEASEIPKALAATADFAAATSSSLETAADLITTYRNVFKDLDDTTISNQLTKAVNISKLTADDLKSILSLSSQVAKSFNLTSEQYLAAVTTLRNSGIKASTVATGLRQGLYELFSPNDATLAKLKKRYAEVGEQLTTSLIKSRFFEFSREDNPLLAVLTELDKLGFADEGQKSLGRVFNVRASNSITALIRNMDELLEAEAKLTFGNAAAEAAEIQMKGLRASLSNLFAAMTVFADQIGGPVVGSLETLIDKATDSVKALNDLDVALNKVGKEGLSGALLPALLGGTAGAIAGKSLKGKIGLGLLGTFAGGASGIDAQQEGAPGLLSTLGLGAVGGASLFNLFKGKGGGGGKQLQLALGKKAAGKGLAALVPGIGTFIALALVLFDLIDLLFDLDFGSSAVEEARRKAEAASKSLEGTKQELDRLKSRASEFDLSQDSPAAGTTAATFRELEQQLKDLDERDTPTLRRTVEAKIKGVAQGLSLLIQQSSDAVVEALNEGKGLDDPSIQQPLAISQLNENLPGLREALDRNSQVTAEARLALLRKAYEVLTETYSQDIKGVEEKFVKGIEDKAKAGLALAVSRGDPTSANLLLDTQRNAIQGIGSAAVAQLKAQQAAIAEAVENLSIKSTTSSDLSSITSAGLGGFVDPYMTARLKDAAGYEELRQILLDQGEETEKAIATVQAARQKRFSEAIAANTQLIVDVKERILSSPEFAKKIAEGGTTLTKVIEDSFGSEEGIAELFSAAAKVDLSADGEVVAKGFEGIVGFFAQLRKFFEDNVAFSQGREQAAEDAKALTALLPDPNAQKKTFDLEREIKKRQKSGGRKSLVEGALEDADNLYTRLFAVLRSEADKEVAAAEKKVKDQFPGETAAERRDLAIKGGDVDEVRELYKLEAELVRQRIDREKVTIDLQARVDDDRLQVEKAAIAQRKRLIKDTEKSADQLFFSAGATGDLKDFRKGLEKTKEANLDALGVLEDELSLRDLSQDEIDREIAARKRSIGSLGYTAKEFIKRAEEFKKARFAELDRRINRPATTGNAARDADFLRVGTFNRADRARDLSGDAANQAQKVNTLSGLIEELKKELASASAKDAKGLSEELIQLQDELQDTSIAYQITRNELSSLTGGLVEATRRTLDMGTLLARFEAAAITFDDLGDVLQGHFVEGLDAVGESLAQAAISGDSLTDTLRELTGSIAEQIFTDIVKSFVNEGISKLLSVITGVDIAGISAEQVQLTAANIQLQAAQIQAGAAGGGGGGGGAGGGGAGGTTPPTKKGGIFAPIKDLFLKGVDKFKSVVSSMLSGLGGFGDTLLGLLGNLAGSLGGLLKGIGGGISSGAGGIFSAVASVFGFKEGGLLNQVTKMAGGGVVSGPGTRTSDSIPGVIMGSNGKRSPVLLSDKEAVLNARAVDLLGEDFVHAVNSGALRKFRSGGMLAEASSATRAAKTGRAAGLGKGDIKELVSALERVQVNANVTNLLDRGSMAREVMNTREGKEGVLNIIRTSRTAVKQELG